MKDLILGAGWPTMATMGGCEAKGNSYFPQTHQPVGISYLIFCKTFCSGERRMDLVPGVQSSGMCGFLLGTETHQDLQMGIHL